MAEGPDADFMQRAIALGERGRPTTPPNPWVGSVVVAGGEVVGEGFHERPGQPHAEAAALAAAGHRARGATVYVTLEPCDHHGRTPPCTEALLAAGVARVVVALEDPDDRARGRGVERLRAAGVEVGIGVGAEAASESLRPYLHHRRTGRPWCVLKAAVSLDGGTAAEDGTSKWITAPEARADAHRLRAASQAVVVGSGTALADRPSLTARDVEPPATQPLRVLLDARGRVPAVGPLFDVDLAPTLVVTTAMADPDTVAAWKGAGAEVEEVDPAPGGVDLAGAVRLLGGRGVLQALFEGGAAVHGSLVAAGLADEVVVYQAGVALGPDAHPMFEGLAIPTLDAAPRFALTEVARLGDDVRLTWSR